MVSNWGHDPQLGYGSGVLGGLSHLQGGALSEIYLRRTRKDLVSRTFEADLRE